VPEALWKSGMPFIQWGLVILASLVAACLDLRWGRIPNVLTIPLWVAGVAWAGVWGGWAAVADSLIASLVLAAPFIWLFLTAGGGAGDAKLMGALGAWLGTINGLVFLTAVLLAGMAMGVVCAMRRRQVRRIAWEVVGMFLRIVWSPRESFLGRANPAESSSRIAMPYGLAICIGAFVSALAVLLWRI